MASGGSMATAPPAPPKTFLSFLIFLFFPLLSEAD
jgi:hypothetical protein